MLEYFWDICQIAPCMQAYPFGTYVAYFAHLMNLAANVTDLPLEPV